MFESRSRHFFRGRPWLGFAVFLLLGLLVMGLLVMGLWNALMPAVFGLHPLHFGQAVGLLILTRILVGFPFRHGGRHFHHRRHMIQRWENMSPEERERFRQGLRHRPHWPWGPRPESRADQD